MRKPDFDAFDATEWMALAESAPEEFEKQRLAAIEHLIARAPQRLHKRLRCLQWRIDMERRKCATPLAACLRLNQMMWDFIFAEQGFLNTLNSVTDLAAPPGPRKCAQILRFPAS